MKNSVVKNFFDKIKSSDKMRYVILFVCVGCLILIVVFNFVLKKTDDKSSDDTDAAIKYVNELEDKLENLLSKVDGAGKVCVCITVESGMETVLAYTTTCTETSSKKETVTTPVIVNGKTVVLKEMYPKISGVLIVSEGAGKLSVYAKLQQATKSILDLDSDKIEILAMK